MGCASSKPSNGDDFKSVTPTANPNAAKEDTIKIALKNKRQNRANVFNAGMVRFIIYFHIYNHLHLLIHCLLFIGTRD